MAYNHRNAKGQLRADIKDLFDNGVLGDWCFDRDDTIICICLPDSETTERGSATSFPIARGVTLTGVALGHSWEWDGNRDAPTITPSLDWIDTWHGWMRNGELVSV